VMNEGELEQVGSGHNVYEAPHTPFVATFVGENNAFYGTVSSTEGNMVKVSSNRNNFLAKAGHLSEGKKHTFKKNDEVIMFVRPESIFLKDQNNQADNIFTAEFKTIEFEGNLKNIYLSIDGKQNVRCSISNAVETSDLSTSGSVELKFSSRDAVVLPIGPLAVD
jgi:spermidine/putrescine transport system ATP-binding protein